MGTVDIVQGHNPAVGDSDIYVVIDVIRAFTTAQIALEQGAEAVVLVGPVDQAFALAAERPDRVLAGERGATMVDGFDLGNSPQAFSERRFDGRQVVLSTTNGVRAALHVMGQAGDADNVLVSAYVNALQTTAWLGQLVEAKPAARISLVASHPSGDEDLACAQFIRARLLAQKGPMLAQKGPMPAQNSPHADPAEVVRRIRQSRAAQKFLDPDRPNFDRRDIELCSRPRPTEFVMGVDGSADRQPVIRAQSFTPKLL